MPRYTEGICNDGAAILEDGEMITIDQILKELNAADKGQAVLSNSTNWLKRKDDYWERRCKAAELFMASHVAAPDITNDMARNYREWLHIAQEDEPASF